MVFLGEITRFGKVLVCSFLPSNSDRGVLFASGHVGAEIEEGKLSQFSQRGSDPLSPRDHMKPGNAFSDAGEGL